MSGVIQLIKFAGGASYPVDVLPVDLRRRWDQAQSRLSRARTGPELTIARVEVQKCARDAALALAATLLLKGALRKPLLGLGLELKK